MLFDGFTHSSVYVCVQYGSHTLAEDIPVGHTVLTIRATDADDPDSGSSLIDFIISAGNDDEFFAVKTDGKGVGYLVIANVKYIRSLHHPHNHKTVTLTYNHACQLFIVYIYSCRRLQIMIIFTGQYTIYKYIKQGKCDLWPMDNQNSCEYNKNFRNQRFIRFF